MKEVKYHIIDWTAERIDAVREALLFYLGNPGAFGSLDDEIQIAIHDLDPVEGMPGIPDGWSVYHDGELVFSVSDDKWDQIGPTVEKIIKS
jgi:hypothetical protein